MRKQRIPWEKAEKIKDAYLIGHAFNGLGEGMFLYVVSNKHPAHTANDCFFSLHGQRSELLTNDLKSSHKSFTPAPRNRK